MANSAAPAWANAAELGALYRSKALSPVEATRAALGLIERLNPALNAFQLIAAEAALADAAGSERRFAEGASLGPLDGVPLTLKDIVATKGWPTRSGSLTTAGDAPADEDAPAVARLREAGAIILGKTTTPEFGWKALTDGPLFGTTRNPWDLARSPGGSSGGAAAALASGIGALAHGTDGGGSIRIPASFCGLYGLKPTAGRVPQQPQTSPFATLVANGPIARSVLDAALMLNELAKPDPRDWLALPYEGSRYAEGLEAGVRGMRIGLTTNFGEIEPTAEIAAAVRAAARVFEAEGAIVEEAGSLIAPLQPQFEAYWLAGFAQSLRAVPPAKHGDLDPGFRALGERGLAVDLPAYCAGVEARARLGVRMAAIHERYDLLLMPTTPTVAPDAATIYHSKGYDRWRHGVPYTVPFNLTGQPAASIPCGMGADGLPIGLQIVGPRFSEARILRASRSYERARPMTWPTAPLAASLARIGAG